MAAWLLPQNSAHWPVNVPVFVALNQVSLVRPRIASNLPPSFGIHQLCATSLELISSVTVVSFGTTMSWKEKAPFGYLNRHKYCCAPTSIRSVFFPGGAGWLIAAF